MSFKNQLEIFQIDKPLNVIFKIINKNKIAYILF